MYADPDDPTSIEINWDQFEATGGADAFREGHHEERRKVVHDNMADTQRNTMVNGWVNATKGGAMSAADLDQALKDAVMAGMLTAEEADAARKSVG